jgi:hypothetical protein
MKSSKREKNVLKQSEKEEIEEENARMLAAVAFAIVLIAVIFVFAGPHHYLEFCLSKFTVRTTAVVENNGSLQSFTSLRQNQRTATSGNTRTESENHDFDHPTSTGSATLQGPRHGFQIVQYVAY